MVNDVEQLSCLNRALIWSTIITGFKENTFVTIINDVNTDVIFRTVNDKWNNDLILTDGKGFSYSETVFSHLF